jgi:hypothetical protein
LTVTEREGAELDALVSQLRQQHGHLLSGEALWRALGFKSAAAFRQAKARGVVGIRLFNIPNRRGTFATAREVAEWLHQVSHQEEGNM